MDDRSLKNLMTMWVLGFACALVLVERWRRMGMAATGEDVGADAAIAAAPGTPTEDGESLEASPVARARQLGSRIGESVALGVKADLKWLQKPFQRAA